MNTGYVCGDSGIVIKTINGGANWTPLNLNSQSYLLYVFFYNAATGYISSAEGTIFRTTNSGLNWLLINGASRSIHSVFFIDNSNGYFSGGNYDIEGNIYRTTNSGLNWSGQFITAEPINSIQFTDINTGYAAGGDFEFGSTIFKTTNGGTNWHLILEPTFGLLKCIKFINSNTGYAAGMPGIAKTNNGGLNWNVQFTSASTLSSVFMINAFTGYAAGSGGVILKTTMGGDTTAFFSISGQIRYRDNNQSVGSGYVKAIHIDSITYAITTLDSAQIQGNGSYMLSHVPPHVSTDIMAFENDEDNPNFVPTYYPSTINWQNATTLNLSTDLTNIDILVYRINNSGGQLHIGGHVYKLSDKTQPVVDGAIVYAKIGGEFKGYSLANPSGAYIAGSLTSDSYILYAERIGYSEITRQVGLANFSMDSIDFILDNPLISIQNESSSIPNQYYLGNSYPNPFNPTVTIKFGLPKTTLTKIIIYDLLGREIITLAEGNLAAGNYSVDWNASEFSSGVYFYRIETNEFTQTKKMVLLK